MTCTRYTLYLGLHTKDGRIVSEVEARNMLHQLCSAVGGYTIYRATGASKGDAHPEPSLVLSILTTAGDLRPFLRELGAAYKTRFNQTWVSMTMIPNVVVVTEII